MANNFDFDWISWKNLNFGINFFNPFTALKNKSEPERRRRVSDQNLLDVHKMGRKFYDFGFIVVKFYFSIFSWKL